MVRFGTYTMGCKVDAGPLSGILRVMANDSTILERVIRPDEGEFSAELARHVLTFDFPPSDHVRYETLSAKASAGHLTPQERAELEEYLDVNDLVTVMKAKARASLQRKQDRAS
jgi:hypothetical protein